MVFPGGIPYPDAPEHGYWGQRTSTIDWCEENYVVSPYVAEAINTTTNAVFMALAVYAMRNVLIHGHEKRFLYTCIGFLTVGIGSWLFHMTLLYEYQLLDELPMIYATCIPYWVVFSFGKSKINSIKVGIQITSAAVILTAVYLYYRNPTIHQTGYGFLNVVVVSKSLILTQSHVHDIEAKQHLFKTLVLGLTSFLLGYALWNLDIHLCNQWIVFRRFVGMPYGFLFEFHGWWHLLTGAGVYFYVVYLEYLRTFLIGREKEYEFIWTWNVLPHVDRKKKLMNKKTN